MSILNWFKKSELEKLIGKVKKYNNIEKQIKGLHYQLDQINTQTDPLANKLIKALEKLRPLESQEEFLTDEIEEYTEKAKSGKNLDLVIATSFAWTYKNLDLNISRMRDAEKIAYNKNHDNHQGIYSKVSKTLRKNGFKAEAATVDYFLTQANLYIETRDRLNLDKDTESTVRNIHRATKYKESVIKEHDEILYHLDAIYRNDPLDKEKALDYFVERGANPKSSEEQIYSFGKKELDLAREVRDITIRALRDNAKKLINSDENWTSRFSSEEASMVYNLSWSDTVEENILFLSTRLKASEMLYDQHDMVKKVKEKFPMQPYQDQVLSALNNTPHHL